MEDLDKDIEDLEMERAPLVTGAMAKYRYTKNLEKKFSMVTRFDEPYNMAVEKNGYIYVPRAICPIGEVDTRVRGHKCGFKSDITPRNKEQVRILDAATEMLKDEESFIIRAGTGTGKTVMGLELMSRINVPTMVVVPKEDLIDQWYEEACAHLMIPKNRIGFVRGDMCDYRGKWLVIAMLHSVAKEGRYPADLYNSFGMMEFDECHRLGAETFSKVCELFNPLLRLGLSATPERSDGKEVMIEAHIGPVKIISDAAPMGFKVLRYTSTWECPRRQVKVGNRMEYRRIEHSAGKCGHIINMVCGHQSDQIKVASWVKKCHDKDRHIIVFSDRIKHLEDLFDKCRAAGVPARDMDYYIGGMSKATKNKAIGKRVLFATYQMMQEGTNLPWFDTIVMTTPRANVKQTVGRIRREHPDKQDPVVFEVYHDDSPVFAGYGRSRDKFYVEEKVTVKNIK